MHNRGWWFDGGATTIEIIKSNKNRNKRSKSSLVSIPHFGFFY